MTAPSSDYPLTPWAAEGRWPTPSELDGWLQDTGDRASRHALLGSYIKDAITGCDCISQGHANRLGELSTALDEVRRLQAQIDASRGPHSFTVTQHRPGCIAGAMLCSCPKQAL